MTAPMKPARAKVRVEYEDGTKAEFNPNKPKFLLQMERKFKVQEPQTHEQLYWLAWIGLGGRAVLGEFDEWVNTVEYVVPVTPDPDDEDGEEEPGESPES